MRDLMPSRARAFPTQYLTIAAAVIGALVSLPATAGNRDRYDDRYYGGDDDRAYRTQYYSSQYDQTPYSDGAYSSSTDFAQVISSRPIIRQVAVNEPRQQCWDEQVTYREPAPVAGNNAAGAILGGIIGGVAGHQFGGGSGRAVATGLGAVVGAGLGSHAGEYRRPAATRTGYETRCQTVDDRRFEDRVEGYDVTYRYNGNVYHTTMPYDPGNRIAVNVDVRPARY